MKSLFDRVREAKANYTHKTREWPDQVFLGPPEYMELNEIMKEYRTYYTAQSGVDYADRMPAELMGMKVIGLCSPGVRVGHTEE